MDKNGHRATRIRFSSVSARNGHERCRNTGSPVGKQTGVLPHDAEEPGHLPEEEIR